MEAAISIHKAYEYFKMMINNKVVDDIELYVENNIHPLSVIYYVTFDIHESLVGKPPYESEEEIHKFTKHLYQAMLQHRRGEPSERAD